MDARDAASLAKAGRIVGPIMLAVGFLLFLRTFLQFGRMDAYGFGRGPDMGGAFLGILLMGAGGIVTQWAFVGLASRYVAHETAPAVGVVTRAVLSEARRDARACGACGGANAGDARFCKACGAPLARACPACGGDSAADARFCDDCGKPLPP